MTVRRSILLPFLSLVVILAACGHGAPDGGGVAGSSIRGSVTSGPQCPVAVAGSPCPDQPWVGVVRILTPGGTQVGEVRTASDGTFAIDVEPGTYQVVAVTSGGPGGARAERVEVPVSSQVRVHLRVDTGIR
jgi:hypothetical protein